MHCCYCNPEACYAGNKRGTCDEHQQELDEELAKLVEQASDPITLWHDIGYEQWQAQTYLRYSVNSSSNFVTSNSNSWVYYTPD